MNATNIKRQQVKQKYFQLQINFLGHLFNYLVTYLCHLCQGQNLELMLLSQFLTVLAVWKSKVNIIQTHIKKSFFKKTRRKIDLSKIIHRGWIVRNSFSIG